MLAPKLRFKEFTEEWKQVRLKDICTVNQGLQIAIENRFLEDGKNRMFYITNEFLKEKSNTKYYIENPPKNVICDKDDLLMTRTGNTGKVITNVSGAFHNNFFRINYEKNRNNKMFLYYILTSNKIQNNIMKLAGSSTIPDLNHSDFYNIKINEPTIDEQHKIANFLLKIDENIESQNNIINNLENIKKGFIQKIFNQEIKFKDDNGQDFDKWENKRIDQLGEFYSGLSSKSKEDFEDGNEKYITYMNVFKNTIANDNTVEYVKIKQNEKQNKVQYGDVLFTQSSETKEEVGMSSVWLSNEKCYLNSFCFGFRFNSLDNINPLFMAYLLRSEKIRREIILQGQGSTRINLTSKRLGKVDIYIPTLKEQEKIANFLSKIDDKIDSEKNILGYWKNIKKGLLQQMFI